MNYRGTILHYERTSMSTVKGLLIPVISASLRLENKHIGFLMLACKSGSLKTYLEYKT